MIKVSIIDALESNKVSPYDHPSVRAKRAEVQFEINQDTVKKPVFERSTRKEIKLEKSKYSKVDRKSKDTFLREILERAIKNMPNWNFRVSQAKY